jgi:hypothetical protein
MYTYLENIQLIQDSLEGAIFRMLPDSIQAKLNGSGVIGWQLTFRDDAENTVLTIKYKE